MQLMRLWPSPTGEIAEGIYAVRTGTVNLFLIRHSSGFLAFDSGFGRRLLLRELGRLCVAPQQVTHLFLTHSDYDHADGVGVFENAEVFLSSDEEPMITRRKARMIGLIFNFGLKRSYHLLEDGQVVSVGETQIRAIATPGHTVGSMSYLVDGRILFVGDTFKLIDGTVRSLRPYINMDTGQQKRSILKLAQLRGVKLACTAHTGCTWEYDKAIRAWR